MSVESDSTCIIEDKTIWHQGLKGEYRIYLQVLRRTLGDVMCGVTQMSKVQKWVTLQPNDDFNPYENCGSKRRLDMRAIAREVAQELGARALPTAQPQLVRGEPNSRNSLLQSQAPIR